MYQRYNPQNRLSTYHYGRCLPAESGDAVDGDAARRVSGEARPKHFKPIDDHVLWRWRPVVKRQVLRSTAQ